MPYIFFMVSLPLNVAYNGLTKYIGKTCRPTPADRLLYMAGIHGIAALLLAPFIHWENGAPPFVLGLGTLFGLVTALYGVLSLRAMSIGPLNLTSLIMIGGTAIPAFSGLLLWQERITVSQTVGFVLLTAALLLCVGFQKTEGEKKAGLRWFLLSLGAALSMGVIGVLQKVFQHTAYSREDGLFLAVAFASGALVLFLLYGFSLLRAPASRGTGRPDWRMIGLMALGGVCVGFSNKLNLFLAGALPSLFFFPAYNGGSVLLTALTGRVLFQERLNRIQLAGFGLGMVSIGFLGNVIQAFF